MGSRRRSMGRSYSGNGRFSAYSLGQGSDGEDNGPLVESRPERRNYLLSVRPEYSLPTNRLSPSSFGRSNFCAIIAQLTEETQPLFETTLKSFAVSEDADAKFTCIVTGYPQPEVTWYKDDEEMDRYCGLPKYEIFRHGNRHTLQLYKCNEEDAAIYQASACNNKGIVSCSGVLEVGTMTEYKIHQRWFAKLKRKAEAKLREIEQSRKRGKENVEMEQLRRVSPDRFQRKRRLTGEIGMHSGTSLWDKEEGAKVHIPDGKARFNEDVDHAKIKEPSRSAAALFSNNFINGRLEAEVTTNGDSSLESAEENGEGNGNGFLSYIYETVEVMKSKPATKEFSAKKKKKEENSSAPPNANQDISRQEDRVRQRRTMAARNDAVPVLSAESMQRPAANGGLMDTESKELASRLVEKPTSPSYFTPSNADVYFSLKDMYFDIGAKPETEQESQEGNADRADVDRPRVAAEETLLATGVALKRVQPEEAQNRPYTKQEVEGNDAAETNSADAAGDFSTPLFPSPNRATEPATEVRRTLRVGTAAEIPDKSTLETDFQPPIWASESGVGKRPSRSKDNQGELVHTNVRETDLLDSLPIDAEPALQQPQSPSQNLGRPCASLCSQEASEEWRPASLGEQLHPEGPGEAPENLKPPHPESLPTDHKILQPADSELREDTNQEADYLTIWEDAPEEPETKWSKERATPIPETQESRMGVSREGDQYTQVTSESSPAVSFGLVQPVEEEHLLTGDAGRLSTRVGDGDEVQHGQAPSPGSVEMVTPGLPALITKHETRPSDRLDQNAPPTEAVIEEKQEETLEQLRDDRPSPNMELELEAERTPVVTSRPLLLPDVAVEAPIPYPRKRRQTPTVGSSQVLHESHGPPPLSAVSGLAEEKEPVGQLVKDVKKELDSRQPARLAVSEPEQQANRMAVEEAHVSKEPPAPLRDEENKQGSLTIGKKPEPIARERAVSDMPAVQDVPQPETAMEEDHVPEQAQHKNLVSSLKNYLLLLLKMTSETDQSKGRTEPEFKAVEERSPPSAIPKHVSEVGIAGLTPRTSRKIFERVETNQLFQSAESLLLTPKTSRKITGMINQELRACRENLVVEPEPPPVPSIVVGSAPEEPVGLAELPPEVSSEAPAALPSATPQELASGARRKIYLPKVKQAEEMEGVAPEGQARPKRDSPAVSPQQSRKNTTLLQMPSPAPSPPVERRSPATARKMATLEVPKLYEEPAEEDKSVAESSQGVQEALEETGSEGEPRKANNPFKAPQVIRKIRAEQFSDASGNLKLWCQFFNILSDSKLTWYKDEIPVTTAGRSCGDEGQAALAIVQASLKDCGVYQCTIQNEYGTDSTDFLLSPEVMSGFISKEEIEAGEEIEMTPMVFAKGLADSGFWGDKLFGRIMMEDLEVGPGFLHKACRARAIYGLEPVFESGHTGIIKVRNLIAFGGRSESTLIERNYDITIQECKIQNSSREYCKIFAAEARAIPAFGPVPEILPLYLIYRPANNIPYATMEVDLPGQFERYCGRARDGGLAPASPSEVGHKCCTFQHWLYQWTSGNFLVTDLEGVGWKITNVRIATKTKGYQGLKESCSPGLLEHFVASHQCNQYCKLLALKSLEVPPPPAKAKGSRSPVTGRKLSPQLQKKGLSSPQAPRKGSVSPKSARKGPEATETQPASRPRAGDNGKAGRLK